MNLCQYKHPEVCYTHGTCPVCEVRDEKNEEIEDRDKIIATMTDEMRDLENRVRELENP